MNNITIINEIWSDNHSKLSRIRLSGSSFLLKSLINFYDVRGNKLLIHEQKILQSIKDSREYESVWYEDNAIKGLLLKDFDGYPLDQFISKQKIDIITFLKIAIHLVNEVEKLHHQGIIHNNITPSKILINDQTYEIKFIDYSSCDKFQEGKPEDKVNLKDFGLDYISPEQTGKLNQSVDFRSDLYSLGIIFYELLAGRKPFSYTDSNQLIHYHVARVPVPLYISIASIPVTISNIVSTLLSKNVQQRYQSAYGLKTDLIRSLKDLETEGKITPFQLAQQDFTQKIQLPKNIYGRVKEIEELKDQYGRISNGNTQFVLVAGESGIGKSILINEFNKSIVNHKGYFVSGKFNQYHNVPYQTFIEALRELVNFIITGENKSLRHWRYVIQEAIGENGKILTDVVPNLESLIGPQPEAEVLPPIEAQNRFNFVARNFFRAIATKRHPLILFIDDLQWADPASLNLLKVLLTDKTINHLLVIASARDNELHPGTLVADSLKEIQKEINIHHIGLNNLTYPEIASLLSDCLNMPYDTVQDLALLIFTKTEGNPFFTVEFLKSLDEKKLLSFNYNNCRWEWNYDRIKQLHVSENVVELINRRIQKFADTTLNTLRVAACLGNSFTLETLSIVLNQHPDITRNELNEAIHEGVILEDPNKYKFSHDKLHHAVYSSIDDHKIKFIHLEIARVLSRNIVENEPDIHIFNIANQYHKSIDVIQNTEEKIFTATLLYQAGIKAKKAAAFSTSYQHFNDSLSLLPKSHWKLHYQLSLNLYTEASESAYLTGDHELMEKLTVMVISNASTVLDKVKVYEIKIRAYTAQGKFWEAVEIALEILVLLGIKIPSRPLKSHALLYLIKTKLNFRFRKIEDLSREPVLTNAYKKAAIRIISNVGSAAYFARQDLFPLLVLESFNIMLKYGNSEYSAFLTASYGLIISAGLKDYDTAQRLINLTYQFLEHNSSRHYAPRTIFMINTFLAHAKAHIRTTIDPLLKTFNSAMKEGDLEFAAYCLLINNYNQFFAGIPLTQLMQQMLSQTQTIIHLKQESPQYSSQFYTQAAFNLHHITGNPVAMKGPVFDEDAMNPLKEDTIASISSRFDYCVSKLMLSYYFDDIESGIYFSKEGDKFMSNSIGTTIIPLFYLFQSLTYIKAIQLNISVHKQKLISKIKHNKRQLKFMAKHAPMNFKHKYYLIKAELYSYDNKNETAIKYYRSALQAAEVNQYINEAALILELTGKHYLRNKENQLAEFYFGKALELYSAWGANSKAQYLIKCFPKLNNINKLNAKENINPDNKEDQLREAEEAVNSFDIKSIMKAAMALSSNLDLEKLLIQLIQISFEYANADKGFLILKRNEEYFIEAEGNINNDYVRVLQSIPCSQADLVPRSILQFVSMTSENLVIHDALNDAKFSIDPVIIKNKSKSVLCIPIIHFGDLMGILYLENSEITHAFTEERINILKLLSGQMAVSIENALNEKKKTAAFIEKESKLRYKNLRQSIISKEIIKTQEYERKRIAEELHDGMGYLLSTLKLNLTALKEAGEIQQSERFLNSSLGLLEESFKELRSISNNLMPDLLHQHGLIMGMDALCHKISSTGKLMVSFKYFNIEGKFSKVFEIEVFRILQELINNVMKHAEATLLEIQAIRQEGTLVFTIEDDGKGFDYEKKIKSKSGGRGLLNIVNRVRYLNGTINYESTPSGTSVIIKLPLKSRFTKTEDKND